jgi:hypothetical protein
MTAKIGHGGRRADLGNIFMRSNMEANYARYLTWLQSIGEIQGWKYESQEFEFPVKRGNRWYKCDFEVTNKDDSIEFHEVKGWMDASSATKLKRMARYYPNIKIKLIDADAYRALARDVSRFIPGWESERQQKLDSATQAILARTEAQHG